MIDLNGVQLRNRVVTSASLLGYGTSKGRLILYGLSPIAQWVSLERFGAVTTRTLTVEPREGHFSLREDWGLHEFPEMLRLYGHVLHRVHGGWINAFGWSNIGPIIATAGIQSYDDCREYFWAGADAVSLGSAVWLAPMWQYVTGPLRGIGIRRLISRVERLEADLPRPLQTLPIHEPKSAAPADQPALGRAAR